MTSECDVCAGRERLSFVGGAVLLCADCAERFHEAVVLRQRERFERWAHAKRREVAAERVLHNRAEMIAHLAGAF